MSRETKDFTIYVDVGDGEPAVCARCGTDDPMTCARVPIPDTETQARQAYVQTHHVPTEDGPYHRYVSVVELDQTEEDAWICPMCRNVHLVEDDDGERVVTLPVRLEVCSRCHGTGYHLTPSIGEHAYSMEEFRESFDPEEAEEYFRRGGIYDVTCERCKGRNVEEVVDEEACARVPSLAADLALCQAFWREEADSRAQSRAEERMERMMSGDY